MNDSPDWKPFHRLRTAVVEENSENSPESHHDIFRADFNCCGRNVVLTARNVVGSIPKCRTIVVVCFLEFP